MLLISFNEIMSSVFGSFDMTPSARRKSVEGVMTNCPSHSGVRRMRVRRRKKSEFSKGYISITAFAPIVSRIPSIDLC